MRTREYLKAKIDELIKKEDEEIFNAPSTDTIFHKTNVVLHQNKIAGLNALRKEIEEATGFKRDIPSQDRLKEIIKKVTTKHPSLTQGLRSRTKALLQNIAPGWRTHPLLLLPLQVQAYIDRHLNTTICLNFNC